MHIRIRDLPPEIWLIICDVIRDLDCQLNRLKSYNSWVSATWRESPRLRKSATLLALSATSKAIRAIVLPRVFQDVTIVGRDPSGHQLQKLLNLITSSGRTRSSMKSSSLQPLVRHIWIEDLLFLPASHSFTDDKPRYENTLSSLIPQLTNVVSLSFCRLVITKSMIEVILTSLPKLEHVALLDCSLHGSTLLLSVDNISEDRRLPLRSLEIDGDREMMSCLWSVTEWLMPPSLTSLSLTVTTHPPAWASWPSLPRLQYLKLKYQCEEEPDGLPRFLNACVEKAPALKELRILDSEHPDCPFTAAIPNLHTIGCRFDDLFLILPGGDIREIILYGQFPSEARLDSMLETLEKTGSEITRLDMENMHGAALFNAKEVVCRVLDKLLGRMVHLQHLLLPLMSSFRSLDDILDIARQRKSLRTMSIRTIPGDLMDKSWQFGALSRLDSLPLLHEVSFFMLKPRLWRKVENVWQSYDPVSGNTTFHHIAEGNS